LTSIPNPFSQGERVQCISNLETLLLTLTQQSPSLPAAGKSSGEGFRESLPAAGRVEIKNISIILIYFKPE